MIPKEANKNWKLWVEERHTFANRPTQGVELDMAALKQHIQRLMELAPKDSTGWPLSDAYSIILKLKQAYTYYEIWLQPPATTTPATTETARTTGIP